MHLPLIFIMVLRVHTHMILSNNNFASIVVFQESHRKFHFSTIIIYCTASANAVLWKYGKYKIALRSVRRKLNNFTVLRFLVNCIVDKRIWPAENDDDDQPTLKLETASCPRVKIGIIGLLHFRVHTFLYFPIQSAYTLKNGKWISYFPWNTIW